MRFVVASHNPHKLEEIRRMLAPLGIDAYIDERLPDVEETGETFEDNALLKARSACAFTGCPAIADDSGLIVDALGGRPGVFSARYAGENATDAERIAKLLGEMANVADPDRTARFVSAVCAAFPDGDTVGVRGECLGHIGKTPRGTSGFGYDPVFIVAENLPGGGHSFAELSPDEKDAVSHRGNALRQFQQALKAYLNHKENPA